MVTEAIGFLSSEDQKYSPLLSQVSTGSCVCVEVPSLNLTSTVAGSTSWPLFVIVRVAPSIFVTARSNFQLFMYHPRQNHPRSSPPSLCMERKKSEGEGCLNAQSRMYLRKAQSKRSGPRICSRSRTMP